MINFLRSAFIRKNTPELRKRLEELGYKPITNTPSNEHLCLATTRHGRYVAIPAEIFDSTNPHVTWNCVGRIDCGANEDLFLAIAALRSDSDKEQWFIYDSTDCIIESMRCVDWIKCDQDKIENMLYYDSEFLNCKKATIEELIGHFSKEQIS